MTAALQAESDALAMLQLVPDIFGAIADGTTDALEDRLGCEVAGLVEALQEAAELFGLVDLVAQCGRALNETGREAR